MEEHFLKYPISDGIFFFRCLKLIYYDQILQKSSIITANHSVQSLKFLTIYCLLQSSTFLYSMDHCFNHWTLRLLYHLQKNFQFRLQKRYLNLSCHKQDNKHHRYKLICPLTRTLNKTINRASAYRINVQNHIYIIYYCCM